MVGMRRSLDFIWPSFFIQGPMMTSALGQAPLLVAAPVAGPQLDQSAVGGGGVGHVQAEPGLHAGDGAAGVDLPLLVRSAVAVPDLDPGAGRGLVVVGVQALGAVVDGEPAARGGPDLARAAAAVEDLQLSPVVPRRVRHVQALARPDGVNLTRGGATAPRVADAA